MPDSGSAGAKRKLGAGGTEAGDGGNSAAVSVVVTDTVSCVGGALRSASCSAVMLRRPLSAELLSGFDAYVGSRPRWPEAEDLHPMEATWDRVALIDFAGVPAGHADPLGAAHGYGRGLPRRGGGEDASGRAAVAEVARVLPPREAAQVRADAEALLVLLREHLGGRQLQVRLEYVVGDTCQRWHRDNNVMRSLVTYAGPGTLVADERHVVRAADGSVDAVAEEEAVQAERGDYTLMKGGMCRGEERRGTAHRAPPIGEVGCCGTHRLMLKVDVMPDDDPRGRQGCTGCTARGS